MAKKIIYIGSTFEDTLQLRLQNASDPTLINPFAIETGSVVQVLFPGGVILSSANVGEVTIIDTDLSTIRYMGTPAQSASLTVGDNQTIDVKVTQGISTKVFIFQLAKALNIITPAN